MPPTPGLVPGQPESDLLDHAHQQRGHVVVEGGGHLAQCSCRPGRAVQWWATYSIVGGVNLEIQMFQTVISVDNL